MPEKAYFDQLQQLMEEWGERFAVATGAPFLGWSLNKGPNGWLLVIRSRSVSRGAVVAFYGGELMSDCIAQLVYDMEHNPGIPWKIDRLRE